MEWYKNTRSLGLVEEEGDFFVVEVHEPVFLMHGVTAEVIAQKHMPVRSVVGVKVLFEVLCNLRLVNTLP